MSVALDVTRCLRVILILNDRLYGLMLHQTYRYYRMYPGDSLALKSLVSFSEQLFPPSPSQHFPYH